jgi:D-methionine transport system ATP-binding protein
VSDAVIRARNLEVKGAGDFVLGPLTLELPRAGAHAVVGRAGAGKSLLLLALAGLVDRSAGAASVDGHDPAAAPAEARRALGLVFQRDALLDDEDALSNVAVAVRARGLDDSEDRAREALALVGLEDARHKPTFELSGGMKKRLGLARALACEPSVFLGDEVTAGLDPSTAAGVLDRIFELRARTQMTCLFATHDVDAVLPRCDGVTVLEAGRVVLQGDASQLTQDAALSAFAPRRSAA